MPGWLLTDESVLLPDADGLRWLDAEGSARGRFDGALASAVVDRLAGAAPSPLLRALGTHGLADRLAEARPLDGPALLRQGGWSQLFVELTARCNESCLHCYAGSSPQRTEALPREVVAEVVREAGALGFRAVQFTGGEALLCPFLSEACGWARAAGIETVEVYTNGLALDATRYAALRAHEVAFAFSLYAASPAVHDAITQVPGSQARTVAAIERALGGGSQVRVGVILTRPQDVAEAQGAAALARRLGVEHVSLDLSRAVGRGGSEGRAVLPIAGEPLRAEASDDPQVAAPRLGGHRAQAAQRGGTAAVLPDGRVVPCIFARDLTLGRVDAAGGLARALTAPTVEIAPCADLDRRLLAAGERLSCGACRRVDALLVTRDR